MAGMPERSNAGLDSDDSLDVGRRSRPWAECTPQLLQAAYDLHPERFPHGSPEVARPPSQVWINKPVIELDVATQDLPTAH